MPRPQVNLISCTQFRLFIMLLVLNVSVVFAEKSPIDYLYSVKSCLNLNEAMVCIKEKILELINETTYSDEVMDFGMFQVNKDANFYSKASRNDIPEGSSRSLALTNAIYEKIEEFFNSRIIKLKLRDVVEARKKGGGLSGYKGGGGGYGGGKKGGGMLVMGGMIMAGIMAQMFMGKIALMAGTALLLAKMALVMATLATFKKSSGDGGGKDTAHVVYTSPETHGGGHGGSSYGYGGNWHRSLIPEEMPQNIHQATYVPQTTNSNVFQYQTRRRRR